MNNDTNSAEIVFQSVPSQSSDILFKTLTVSDRKKMKDSAVIFSAMDMRPLHVFE